MIYFIQSGEDGPVKIGLTAGRPETRLRAFQVGSPVPLYLRAVASGGPAEEAALHERFAAYRLTGEWFSPAPGLLAFIGSLQEPEPEPEPVPPEPEPVRRPYVPPEPTKIDRGILLRVERLIASAHVVNLGERATAAERRLADWTLVASVRQTASDRGAIRALLLLLDLTLQAADEVERWPTGLELPAFEALP